MKIRLAVVDPNYWSDDCYECGGGDLHPLGKWIKDRLAAKLRRLKYKLIPLKPWTDGDRKAYYGYQYQEYFAKPYTLEEFFEQYDKLWDER